MRLHYYLLLISLLPGIKALTAQPMATDMATEAGLPSLDAFEYRSFANRTLHFSAPPAAIPREVEYFRTRIKTYEAHGETPTRGYIKGYDGAGNLRFDAQYLRHHLHGPCKSIHPNGQLRDSGALLMNLPHGQWRFYDDAGQLMAVRNYDAYLWWALQWSIQLQNPFWNRFELTTLYNTHPNQFYKAVVAHQSFTRNYSPLFEYGVQQGPALNYYPNGQLADSSHYYKGLLDGIWIAYHENGQLKTKGAYQMGQKQGTWVYHHENGSLKALEVYKKGRLVESKQYP
ncbi:MAG TPA: hypothetical protein PKD90_05890 [Phnomibacter sp.]|nr:hypothetical protein [Phnomibacter sp.]